MAATLLRMHVDPQGDLLDATLACEADVFCEWFGNTREQLAEEYAPYAASSVFVALTDHRDEVVAAGRGITPGPAGVKTLVDAAGEPWHLDAVRTARATGLRLESTWDCASIAVRPELRGARALGSAALLHGLFLLARENGCSHIVAVLDDTVRAHLEAVGLVYRTLPGASTAPYLGSPGSTPVYAPLAELLDRQRRTAPEAHRLIALGTGLDGVSVPPLEAFRLRTRPELVDLRTADAGLLSGVPRPRDGDRVQSARH